MTGGNQFQKELTKLEGLLKSLNQKNSKMSGGSSKKKRIRTRIRTRI